MPTRIDKLTPAQEAAMAPWAEEWIARGLKTGRTEWARGEAAVREWYALANLNLAIAVRRLGRHDEALRGVRKSLVLDARSARAWKPSMIEAGKGQGWEEL